MPGNLIEKQGQPKTSIMNYARIVISFEYSPWCPLILLKYKFLKKMEFQDEKVHFQEIQFLRPSLIVKVTKKKEVKQWIILMSKR